ncbi:MAG TPA: VWA domain-containing protein [Bryobacteraceae bacterium]
MPQTVAGHRRERHRPVFGAALFASVLAVFLSILPSSIAKGQTDASNQAGPEVTSSQAAAVFTSSSNLVQVPVVVRDNSGHAVGALRAEDFQVFDNGKPETISRFSIEKFDANDVLKNRAGSLERQSPEITAQLANRYVGMLLDDVSLSVVDLVRGRNAALHYVDTLRPEERVAVYSASGKTTLDFTGDRQKLRNALVSINSVDANSHYRLGDGQRHCRVTYYNLDMKLYQNDDDIPGCKGSPAEMWYIMQNWGEKDETAYFQALQNLVAKISVLPGQRSILLLSPGIYVPDRYRRQFKDILAAAIRAQVVINGVDPRGVIDSDGQTAEKRVAPATPIVFDEQQGGAFLDEITSGSGGIYYRENDPDAGIQRAESIPEYIYLLAFTPADLRFDGKRHNLKVTLKNDRGLTVQARNGYFADIHNADPADSATREIEEAFFSSKERDDLPVRLRTKFYKDGDAATLTITANVDASRLTFRKEDGRNLDNLTLVVGLFDQNGNFISAIQKDVRMQLKDATLRAWIQSGIPAFPPPPISK